MAPKTKSPKKGQQKERSKHINVNSKQTIAAITELRNRNEGDVYMRVNVASHFRKICRTITNHSCWINAVSTSSKYVPMLQRTLMDDELRMRSVGASGSSGPTVAVFDLETGKTLFMIEGHETVVYSIAISSPHYDSGTNPVLVTGSHDGFMKVWELKTGLMLLDLGKNIHKGPVRAVCVIEGRLPTIYSGSNNEVFAWLLETGDLITKLNGHTKNVTSLYAFRSNHTFADYLNPAVLVSCGLDGIVNVWDMTSPTYALKYTFTEHEGPVFCCTVARYENENPIAITCGFDQTIKIWNLVTGKLHDEFRGHSSAVHALSVIHTTIPGLVSGSADGLIIIWNLITGERLGELVGHTGMIRSLSVTLQPRLMIVSGSYDNTVKIWDITLPGNDSDLLLQINESLQYEEDDNGEKSNVDICNTVEERK